MMEKEEQRLFNQHSEAHPEDGETINRARAKRDAEAKRDRFRKTATDEYFGDMAGRVGEGGFERLMKEEQKWWMKIKKLLIKLLSALKLPKSLIGKLHDRDLLGMLGISYAHLKGKGKGAVVEQAYVTAMREKTGFGKEPLAANGKGASETLYRIMGEKGAENLDRAEEATHRMDNLAVARQMESAGKDAAAIHRATGWERGADKKWRYEVADNLENVSTDDITHEGKTLGEILGDGHDLLTAYPGLKDVKVRRSILPSKTEGTWSAKERTIKLDIAKMEREWGGFLPDEFMQDTLIHEIQHAIQTEEGFENGASVKFESGRMKQEYPQLAGWAGMLKPRVVGEFTPENIRKYAATRRVDAARIAFNEIADLLESGSITADDIAQTQRQDFESYRRVAGEVEARNATERAYMTDEERRNTPLYSTEDVAREDQVFLGAIGYAGESANVISVDPGQTPLGARIPKWQRKVSPSDVAKLPLEEGDALKRFLEGHFSLPVNVVTDFSKRPEFISEKITT